MSRWLPLERRWAGGRSALAGGRRPAGGRCDGRRAPAASRRRFAPRSEGEAGGPALHGGGGQPHRPVRLQARADQAARPAVATSASGSRRSRTASARGCRPVFDFRPHGPCGKMLGEVVAPLGAVVDDIAFIHNMVGKTGVHSQGTLLQTTGFNRPGSPSMGSWVSYGLGRMNENLPAFVVLPDHSRPGVQRHQELGLRRSCRRSTRGRSSTRARSADRRPLPRPPRQVPSRPWA